MEHSERDVYELVDLGYGRCRMVLAGAAGEDRAEDLRRSMAIEEDPVEFSPSMGIHTGPGVVGVAWLAAA
jgi:fatty acid-binding protein DegV